MGAALSPSTHTAEDVVRLLQLAPLASEGGWFRRTAEAHEPSAVGGSLRRFAVIYGLFTPQEFSALHRLTVDEIWCFHAGDPLDSLRLYDDGRGERVRLGLAIEAGERAHDSVPAGTWQGARLVAGGRWALVSCVTVPEFTWEGFALGDERELTSAFPAFTADIRELTRRG